MAAMKGKGNERGLLVWSGHVSKAANTQATPPSHLPSAQYREAKPMFNSALYRSMYH
jgi:hypothetical protein